MADTLNNSLSRGPLLVQFACELEFAGPLHVGTGEALSMITDAPLLRDAEGSVWLPGSSVRGVLADWCQREAPLLGVDRGYVRRLFGVTPGSGAGARAQDWQGRLTVLDLELQTMSPPQVRDHVRIKREWGAADRGAKFDQEVAYACSGTLRLIYEGDKPDDPELVLLQSVVKALQEGLLAFGGKTGWGLGATRIGSHGWSSVDRSDPNNLSAHLTSQIDQNGSAPPLGNWQPSAKPSCPRSPNHDEPEAWSWLRVDLALSFDGPMLVAAIDTTDPDDASSFAGERREADAVWQTRPDGEPVLTGSALRGPLRSIADRIGKTLDMSELPGVLFGSVSSQGLIRVEEGRLHGDLKPVLLNHVAIDRVTGFAAKNLLFNAAALASPCFHSRILVRWNHAVARHRQAVALLLFVLRDGAERGLWVGSRTTRGYGYLKTIEIETAKWSLVDSSSGTPRRLSGTLVKESIPQLGECLAFIPEAWQEALCSRKAR